MSNEELRERRELVVECIDQGLSIPLIARRLGVSLFSVRKDYEVQKLLENKTTKRMRLKVDVEQRFPKLAGRTFEVLASVTSKTTKRVHLIDEETGKVYCVLKGFLERVKNE